MSDWWSFRPHPGVRAANSRPDYLLAEDTVAPPQCERHNASLDPVTVDGLDLKDGATLSACPRCFRGDDGVDTAELRDAIADEWGDYQSYFTQREPPRDGDSGSNQFEVY